MKNLLLITDQEKDNIKLRKKLEDAAIACFGNLHGLRVSDDKKIIYLFNFKSENGINRFKASDIIKKYEIVEA